MGGETAKRLARRSIAHHAQKDDNEWKLRVPSLAVAGDAITQPSFGFAETAISPIVENLNEHEAQAHGLNLRAGDYRLTVDGFVEWTPETQLYCNDKVADVKKVVPELQHGKVRCYKVYVRRKDL